MGYPPTEPATWPGRQYIKGNCREQGWATGETTGESMGKDREVGGKLQGGSGMEQKRKRRER